MRRTLPSSRTRRIAKWTGLVVCVVVLGMWAVSILWPVLYYPTRQTVIGLCYGEILIADNAQYRDGWVFYTPILPYLRSLRFSLPRYQNNPVEILIIPVWLAVLIFAIPTAVLWHRDRRTVKPGCCQTCGYDLRASKKTCPECGTAVARPAK